MEKEIFSKLQKKQMQAPLSMAERRNAIDRIRHYVLENESLIIESIRQDFKRPVEEIQISEIITVITEANDALKHMHKWTRKKRVKTPLTLIGTSSWVYPEPKGLILILSPWNYPFALTINPLIAAIAAGNRVVVKPSEVTPHTSAFIKQMLESLFSQDMVATFNGDVETANRLLDLPFNHIFFTGSTPVGKIIMQKAAKHLSSVTLELGGKSPTIVDDPTITQEAARKIIWGKFMNSGQTCVAPDYLLVNQKIWPKFKEELNKAVLNLYAHYDKNPDYGAIVSPRHFSRLKDMLQKSLDEGAQLVSGGHSEESLRKIEPTILENIQQDSSLMQEEIFGPILPVITYQTLDEAIEFIQQREKPLSLYVFSHDKQVQDRVLNETSSGGTCVNEVLLHLTNPYLPFGGVNHSGIGKYHGQYGFNECSNEKAVLIRKHSGPSDIFLPPYTPKVKAMLNKTLKHFHSWI